MRTQSIPAPVGGTRTAVARSGAFVTSGAVSTSESVGLPLHLISADGLLVRSFGDENPIVEPGHGVPLTRAVSWTGDTTAVWAVPRDEYRLERWTVQGSKVVEWVRPASWMSREAGDDRGVIRPGSPPAPRIQAIRTDDQERVWVLAHVPGRDWEAGVVEREGPDGPIYEPVDFERVFDTMVEVIGQDGVLLVSRRFEEYLIAFTESGSVVGYREPVAEMPYLDISDVVLDGLFAVST